MTVELLLQILSWCLPPILGAAIGFITNAIAIKMLFRPLTEKRIFGIRIPFTPGIIPKQRYQLAESIGRMVSRELITEKSIVEQLSSPGFQTGIRENISSLTNTIFNTPLAELRQSELPLIEISLEDFLNTTLKTFFGSPVFKSAAQNIISSMVQSIFEKKIGELDKSLKLKKYLTGHIMDILHNDEIRDQIIQKVNSWLLDKQEKKAKISSIITPDITDLLMGLFQSVLPYLIDSLFKWLRTGIVRKDLENKARAILKDILDKLNLMQRFIVSVGQYDTALHEKMPEIIEEILHSMELVATDAANRQKMVEKAKKGLMHWTENKISVVLKKSNTDIARQIKKILTTLWESFKKQEVQDNLHKNIVKFFSRNKTKTIGELLSGYLGIEADNLVSFFMKYITEEHFPENFSQKCTSFVFGFIERRRNAQLKDFLGIDIPKKKEIDDFIQEKLNYLIKTRFNQVIESLDVKQLVVNKINKLDVAQVESLLLMVIARHLKWINVFGAILGAIIGFSQLILFFIGV